MHLYVIVIQKFYHIIIQTCLSIFLPYAKEGLSIKNFFEYKQGISDIDLAKMKSFSVSP